MSNRFLSSYIKFNPHCSLPCRLVIVPITNQCERNGIPSPTMAAKYADITNVGLVITEPTTVLPLTRNYFNCPGIYSIDQIKAWRKITEALHKQGKKIFLQLWHCGLTTKPCSLDRESIITSKATVAREIYPLKEKLPLPIPNPHTLKTEEIPKIVKQFRRAAQNALAAEFDGVEIHTAFGYLTDWFFKNTLNQPTNNFAEDLENRTELITAVLENVASIWDEERVGVKVSPSRQFLGFSDPDPEGTFYHILDALNYYNLAYVQFVDANKDAMIINESYYSFPRLFRNVCKNAMMLKVSNDLEETSTLIANDELDLISQYVRF